MAKKRKDEDVDQDDTPAQASPPRRVSWPGSMVSRWFGARRPPRFDPNKSRAIYEPFFQIVKWYGDLLGHQYDGICGPPRCKTDTSGYGHHEERREDGFAWEGSYFPTLPDAMENQAFRDWYENRGGREIVEQGQVVLRKAQYSEHEEPPLPKYNFFLHEHVSHMTPDEVREYERSGFVPVQCRRRGRAAVSLGEEQGGSTTDQGA